MSAPRRICLLGSSCNPPTGDGGHRLLAKHFAALYDEVWVLPVYKHIFANKSNLAPFEERVAMARINFESVAPNVRWSGLHFGILGPTGTLCVSQPLCCSPHDTPAGFQLCPSRTPDGATPSGRSLCCIF